MINATNCKVMPPKATKNNKQPNTTKTMNVIYLTPHIWQTDEINELAKALKNFNEQFEGTSLVKDKKNPHLKNEYVSLDNLLNTVRPLLTFNGLVITQDLAGGSLVTTLLHTSGQFKGSAMNFSPMSDNKGINNLQGIGGGITYAKRYAVGALLSISVDTDDDANEMKDKPIKQPKEEPKQRKTVTDEQIPNLITHAIQHNLTIKEVEAARILTPTQKADVLKALKDNEAEQASLDNDIKNYYNNE